MPRNPPNAPLSGKVALITGASRGLGFAMAEALAEQGCSLWLAGRDTALLGHALSDLAKYKVSLFASECDVREPESVARMLLDFRRKHKRLDILINNAGIAPPSKFIAHLPLEDWFNTLATNLSGPFLVTQAALSQMKAGGIIVNNLSVAARQTFPGSAAYCASKAGLLAFTNVLREELRAKKIRVLALIPGATDTEIWDTLWPAAPRKKMMKPETVAGAVVNAILTPADASLDELHINPPGGAL
jgi:NAD(P)-dependent dehydrogenase (short-subunit alcohol dehydrogenase family)